MTKPVFCDINLHTYTIYNTNYNHNIYVERSKEKNRKYKQEDIMEIVAQTILWTQIPITIAILIGVYELYKTKKELIKLLKDLSKK